MLREIISIVMLLSQAPACLAEIEESEPAPTQGVSEPTEDGPPFEDPDEDGFDARPGSPGSPCGGSYFLEAPGPDGEMILVEIEIECAWEEPPQEWVTDPPPIQE